MIQNAGLIGQMRRTDPRSVVSVSEILRRLDGELPAAVAAELERLRAENARLLRLLRLTPTEAAPPGPAQAGYGIRASRTPSEITCR